MSDFAQSGLALKGAGTALSTAGSFNQAETQKGVLDYESQVAGNNAIYAGYQATVAKEVGEQQVQTSEMKTTQLEGAQTATLAANGVSLGSGTAQDILASTKYMGARRLDDSGQHQSADLGVGPRAEELPERERAGQVVERPR
jgi:hypothetical protein